MFVTDPPLLADIGSMHFENYNTSFIVNGKTAFQDNQFEMEV